LRGQRRIHTCFPILPDADTSGHLRGRRLYRLGPVAQPAACARTVGRPLPPSGRAAASCPPHV